MDSIGSRELGLVQGQKTVPPGSPKHGEPIAQKEMAFRTFRTSFVGDAARSVPALVLYKELHRLVGGAVVVRFRFGLVVVAGS